MRIPPFKTFLIFSVALALFPTQQAFAGFSDLPETHHHYFPISYLELEGVIKGYDDGMVRPDNLINRAELIKILVEGKGNAPQLSQYSNCFPDVKREWFAPSICFAKSAGWIQGYPDGSYHPAQYVNKVEALKMISIAFDIGKIPVSDELIFSDTARDDWFAGYLAAAVQKNLLEEVGGKVFSPSNPRNRGEISEMVARIMMIRYMDDPAYNDLIKAEFQNYLLINQLRGENGVMEKLTLNPILTKVAREHARDMGDNIRELSHTGSDGVTLSYERIKNEIGKSISDFEGRTGENIGGGGKWADPFEGIKWVHENIFMPEDPNVCNHRTTLLSQCLPFTEVGIGVYVNDEGRLYFVNDFITLKYAEVML